MSPEQDQPSDEERKQRAVDLAIERTELAQERTELAEERTKMAARRTLMALDRTLMAWIRTAVTMIGIGVAIYEFLRSTGQPGTPSGLASAEVVALFLISLGVFALAAGTVHYWYVTKRLGRDLYPAWKLTLSVSCVVMVIGVLLVIALAFGLGPLF